MLYSRQIEVRREVDVLVAGGGPAGVAAAVMAARQGASVFLAEAQTCLGGMGTSGMLPIFMEFGDTVHFYAGGFGREVWDLLEPRGATIAYRPWGRFLPIIRAEPLKRLYDDLVGGAGVEISLQTHVIDVEAQAGRVSAVVCAAKSGLFAIRPRMVVDATGDGDVAAQAGAPFEKSDGELMGVTLCSLWADIDWEKGREAIHSAERVLIEALRADPTLLPNGDPHLPGVLPVGGSAGGGNVGHCYGIDGTDERSITRAMIEARALLPFYERFYRTHLPGFENAQVVATASQLGVRETRRIMGDCILTGADYTSQATFDDEIGRYRYWIDTHLARPSLEDFQKHKQLRAASARLKDGQSYGIPYRILTPRGLENVLVAGRCVSCDRAMQSSLRVMPGCYITGQAAGVAAAMAAAAGSTTRQVPIRQLQARLRSLGAFLPNPIGQATQ